MHDEFCYIVMRLDTYYSELSVCFVFFFSSRRRHTRLQGDWSSDMCSSDLTVTGALEGEELKRKIADVHFVGIRSRTQLTADVFAAAQKLVAVGCFCIGTNQVDLDAARERGVVVFNAPYSNTRSVAELVLAEAILLLRGVPAKNASAHRGGWLKSAENSYEIRGKTLGIVGILGAQIGRAHV